MIKTIILDAHENMLLPAPLDCNYDYTKNTVKLNYNIMKGTEYFVLL